MARRGAQAKGGKTPKLNVYVTQALQKDLAEASEVLGYSVSEIIRLAVTDWLQQQYAQMKIHGGPRVSLKKEDIIEQVVSDMKPLIQSAVEAAYLAGEHPEMREARMIRLGVKDGKKIAPYGQEDSIELAEGGIDWDKSQILMEVQELHDGKTPEEREAEDKKAESPSPSQEE